jgi:ParB family chromosome partitioning protein
MAHVTQLTWSGDSALPRLSSKSNEWYTPALYLEVVRDLLGTIDLDPASCAYANAVVQASRLFDKQTNGLLQPWHARTVFVNPPYGRGDNHRSNQEIWTCKLISEYHLGHVQEAVLLVNAATDTGWFQRLWFYSICFVNHRIDFYTSSGERGGPTHGSVFVYFGPQLERFSRLFAQFGRVVPPLVEAPEGTLWDGGAVDDTSL